MKIIATLTEPQAIRACLAGVGPTCRMAGLRTRHLCALCDEYSYALTAVNALLFMRKVVDRAQASTTEPSVY
jgi:hypothetical protein